MIIKRKKDIESFVHMFDKLASWDGTKYYLNFVDEINKGIITIMKYVDGSMTIYRSYELFWDIKEHSLEEKQIWNYRKYINNWLKKNEYEIE
ncbi:hypothetical protein [Niallia sp.]|uniref:hypothetical protein n=1 Tax=Niallia sp. TaxID=2837523 RepID=UPI00289EE923|nr:hypothetical protein [Niallia sp.]